MSKYRYETVNVYDGRVGSRWYVAHPSDDSAVAGLNDVRLKDDESVRVLRDGEDEPFAGRDRDEDPQVFG